ncbi:hypothetical protein B1218_37030, partial [Pseudomonas ogarae]
MCTAPVSVRHRGGTKRDGEGGGGAGGAPDGCRRPDNESVDGAKGSELGLIAATLRIAGVGGREVGGPAGLGDIKEGQQGVSDELRRVRVSGLGQAVLG